MRPPFVTDRDLVTLQVVREQRKDIAPEWRTQYDGEFLRQNGRDLGNVAIFYWSCITVFQDNPKKMTFALIGSVLWCIEILVKQIGTII